MNKKQHSFILIFIIINIYNIFKCNNCISQTINVNNDSQIYYLNRPTGFHPEHNNCYECQLLDSAIYFNYKQEDSLTIFYCQKSISVNKILEKQNFSLSYLLGLSYFYRNKLELSKKYLLLAITNLPNHSIVDSSNIYSGNIYEKLSSCYLKINNIDSGEYYINKALKIYDSISPEKMSSLYFNLSVIYNKKNDYREKTTLLKFIHTSIEGHLNNENSKEYTNVLEKLSLIYNDNNLPDSSIIYLNEIISTYQKGIMEDSLRIPWIYYNLAIIYKNTNNNHYKEELLKSKLSFEKYNYYYTVTYNLIIELLGVNYERENNYDEAVKYYKYSIELQKKYPKSKNQFGAFYNLVNLYVNNHNFEDVEALSKEINNLNYDSLKIKLFLRLADGYNGIGLIEKAIYYYNLYLPFASTQDSISYLNLLGSLYLKKGAYNLAKEKYKKSLFINSDSTNQIFYETILLIIDIDIIQNNLTDVNNNINFIINNYKINNNSSFALKISNIYSLLENEKESIKWLNIYEELSPENKYLTSYIKSFNYYLKGDYINSNKFIDLYIKEKPKSESGFMLGALLFKASNYYYLKQYDSSFMYIQYYFNRNIEDIKSHIKYRDEESNIENLHNHEIFEKQLIYLISKISRTKIKNKQIVINNYFKYLLYTKQIILKSHYLSDSNNNFKTLNSFKSLPKNYNLNKLLPKQDAYTLIEIITHYQDIKYDTIAYDVLMVNSKDTNVKIFSIPKGDSATISIHQIISDSNKINYLYNNINNYYLTDNLIKIIDSECPINNNLFISLSGEFNYINIPCIYINKDSNLEDKYKIHLLGSTADILNYEPNYFRSIKEIVTFGDIDFDRSNNSSPFIKSNIGYSQISEMASRSGTSRFAYLPGTKKEIEDISKLCVKNNMPIVQYKGSNASEENFKKLNGKNKPYILHIATHGFFFADPIKTNPTTIELLQNKSNKYKLGDDPLLRSGLILSGANATWGKTDSFSTTTEDGILTSYEIANTDLSGCQLVVLSACETGLGDINASEGVFGLQRAFKMAGVKNIIMSLWKVDDNETPKLMNLFYNNCFKGESAHDALQHAQNEMKINGYAPYYWAGFKLLE